MRNDLASENITLVYYVLKKMHLNSQRNMDRYFDVGLIGLVKAANNYDPNTGVYFSTYAVKCIQTEILAQIRHENMPKRIHDQFNISLETVVNNKGNVETTLLDYIPSKFNLEEYTIRKEQMVLLNSAIKTELDDRQRKALSLYLDGMHQKDIAKELNMAQSYVSRYIKRIIKKLKKKVNK